MYGKILSNTLLSFLAAGRMEDDACPDHDATLTGLVDYRDLLLSEEGAIELKGRGGSYTVNLLGTCTTT